MKIRLFLAALALLVLAGAGAAAWYYNHTSPNPRIYGSSTREFNPQADPEIAKLPPRRIVNREPWPLYGYDRARTHVSPYAHRPPYRRIWTVRLGYFTEFPPVVAYHRLFATQNHARFYTIDVRTGKIIWRKHFADYCSAASPAVGDGVVYITYLPRPCSYGDRSKHGIVVAMRVRGGRILWRFPVSSESSPLLLGRVLYFGAWDHKLYALDVHTRRVRWTFTASSELNTSPAYANGTIYIASNDGKLYAVNAKTGRLRWSANSFSGQYFYATPTVAYGRVYIGNTDGTVYAYGASTGHLLWAQPAGSYVYAAAAVWRRTVYVGSYDGNVYAFDAATGHRRWVYSSPGSIHGAPTVMGGLVYFSTCGTCGSHGSRYAKRGPRITFALDARTGKRVWTFPKGHYSPIVADGDRVYLTGDTRVYALLPIAEAKSKRSGARHTAAHGCRSQGSGSGRQHCSRTG